MRDWENEESSNTCPRCKREVFGQCEEFFTPSTMHALADASRGFDTTSWDEFRLKQEQDSIQQMDQDDQYINEVTQ